MKRVKPWDEVLVLQSLLQDMKRRGVYRYFPVDLSPPLELTDKTSTDACVSMHVCHGTHVFDNTPSTWEPLLEYLNYLIIFG